MTAGAFGDVAAGLIDRLDPERRGPDRRVRRESLDENHAGAQPWGVNRFSSPSARYATTESMVDLAKEMQREAHAKFPRPVVRELKERRQVIEAELAAISAGGAGAAPIGRPATLHVELRTIEAQLEEHDNALTRTDVDVLEALLSFLRRTGEWIASWAMVAEQAGCERKGVGRALARLKHHGLLARIRRSRRVEENKGAFAPQREQIANAYRLTIAKLAGRFRERFLQLREKRYRRMTRKKEAPATPAWPAAGSDGGSDMQRAVASLGASIDNASP